MDGFPKRSEQTFFQWGGRFPSLILRAESEKELMNGFTGVENLEVETNADSEF
ncbi:hypothetical protein AB3N59_16120 [Leptospira sp. WS92.C1]